jgi:hypothetical protein
VNDGVAVGGVLFGAENKKAASANAALAITVQILRFIQANLSFVDSFVQVLDRFVAMAMELAFGMHHVLPGALHCFDRVLHARV